MNINKKVVMMLLGAFVLVFQVGCTYLSPDGIPMEGGVIEGRVGDIGASATLGVRERGGYPPSGYGQDHRQEGGDYYGGGGPRPPGPCDRTHATMESAGGLMNWASNGGQGQVERRAQANANESAGGRGGYNCNAQTSGVSRQVNGMEAPPRRMQSGPGPEMMQGDPSMMQQGNGYRPDPYQQPQRRQYHPQQQQGQYYHLRPNHLPVYQSPDR